MKDLLEHSPLNAAKGENYDVILGEFWAINKLRNEYVHGGWWTSVADDSVWLAKGDKQGLGFKDAKPVRAAELIALLRRMEKLKELIAAGPLEDMLKMPPPAPT